MKKSEVEEEDASSLKLGFDFEKAQCLSMSEVKLVCESKLDDDQDKGEETSTTQTRVFEKTLAYVRRFHGDTNAAATSAIRALLQQRQLHDFEVATVSNLKPMEWDEAKALVPSLEMKDANTDRPRFEPELIAAMLEEMADVRKFN